MSLRTIKKPLDIPKGVEVKVNASNISIKGPKDTLSLELDKKVKVEVVDNKLHIQQAANNSDTITGTVCAHIKNMLTGVTVGFSKKLDLVGVGYRASMKGNELHLSLGFSHPVIFTAPAGVTIETPTQTEIIVKGANRQVVGQAAADIRGFRPPEPYKGKGVKYSDEVIIIKETKKK